MLPASPVKHPKRRQTCDPCRKAKIKCDKRTPICGRCLATGDLCDYGISRQGAWWRHKGRGRSIQHGKDDLTESSSALYLPPAYSEGSSSISPTSSANLLEQDAIYDNELGFNCLPGDLLFDHLCSNQFTPPDSVVGSHESKGFMTGIQSPLLYDNQHWPTASTVSQFAFPDNHRVQDNENLTDINATLTMVPGKTTSPRNSAEFHQCTCFRLVLRVLQALEDSSLLKNDRNLRTAAAESATILETNDRNVDCCWTIIRCKSCSNDHNRSATMLLYTLIKKELLLLEHWLFACSTQVATELPSTDLAGSTQDRHMKISTAQIVARRLKEILSELGQTCQTIGCDYIRLAHAFLVENILLQLDSVSEKLNVEIKVSGSCLAVIRSIESGNGIGLEGHHQP